MKSSNKGDNALKLGVIGQFYNEIKFLIDSQIPDIKSDKELGYSFYQMLQKILCIQFLQHAKIVPEEFLQKSFSDGKFKPKIPAHLHLPFNLIADTNCESEISVKIPPPLMELLLKIMEKYEWDSDETKSNKNVITPEILAYVYERNLDDQQKSGSFYTPKSIAEYIAHQTIWGYITYRINGQFSHHYEDLEKELLKQPKALINEKIVEYMRDVILPSIRICDNSCGAGAFLIAAVKILFENHSICCQLLGKTEKIESSYKERIIQEIIYGVDLNNAATNIAKIRLWFIAVTSLNAADEINSLNKIQFHIRNGNTLIGSGFDPKDIQHDTQKYPKLIPFDWGLEFPEIAHQGGFDIIIGNPPYIRQEKVKHLTDEFGIAFKSLLEQYYSPYNSQFDLAIYFILRSLQLLKPEGFHAYIVTSKWLRAKYGEKIKNFLFTKTNLYKIVDFTGTDVFPGATIDTIIYFLSKIDPKEAESIIYCKAAGISDLATIEAKKYIIPYHELAANGWIFLPTPYYEISRFLQAHCQRVKDLPIKIYRGVTTGFNSAFVISAKQKDTIIQKEPDAAIYFHPVITGDELEPYGIQWKQQFLLVVPDASSSQDFPKQFPTLYQYMEDFSSIRTSKKGKGIKRRDDQGNFWWELRTCEYYPEFLQPKLVWQRVTQEPRFYLDRNGMYLLDSTSCLRTDLHLLKILQLIFSSSFIHRFYVKHFVHLYGTTGYLLSNQYVERIPICPIKENPPFIILADYLSFLHLRKQTLTESNEKSEMCQDQIHFFQDIANLLVYDAYFHDHLYPGSETEMDLIIILRTQLDPIPFDAWIMLSQTQKISINISISGKAPTKTTTDGIVMGNEIQLLITKVYESLKNNAKLKTQQLRILNDPWITLIEHDSE